MDGFGCVDFVGIAGEVGVDVVEIGFVVTGCDAPGSVVLESVVLGSVGIDFVEIAAVVDNNLFDFVDVSSPGCWLFLSTEAYT